MKCFIGIEKLENITMSYRELVQTDKDWNNMFRFFCSYLIHVSQAAKFCSL